MNEILIANLTLDTTKRNNIAPLIVPQGDYGARVIRSKITDLGKPVIVESTAAVSIVSTRSGDGESQAFSGSVNADGTVTVPVTQWMLDVPEEDVTCHIVVTGIGYQYSTTSFLIEPQAKATPTEIAPDDPRQDLVTEVLAGENTRRAAEAERVSNENARIAAENARQSAEEQRVTDESTRITNEAKRVSAESSRDATFRSWAQDIASLPTFDGRISANRKRIENLESGIPAESFIIDDSVAYTKDVPENVAPNAVVAKLGGMTYKDGDTLHSAKVTEVKSVGVNLLDESVLLKSPNITFSDTEYIIQAGVYEIDTGINYKPNTRYTLAYAGKNDSGAVRLELYYTDGTKSEFYFLSTEYKNLVFTTAENKTVKGLYCHYGAGGHLYIKKGTIMIYEGADTKPYTPYVEHTLPIPEAVRPANGINENVYDFIEWAEDGSVKKTVKCGVVDLGTLDWQYVTSGNKRFDSYSLIGVLKKISSTSVSNIICTKYEKVGTANQVYSGLAQIATTDGVIWICDTNYADAATFKAAMSGVMLVYELAEPEVTDISDLITADNLVPVQSGGTMTPVNEYSYAVPSTIIYQSR